MTFLSYIKDKWISIVISVTALLIIFLFLITLKVAPGALIMTAIILFVSGTLMICIDYFRRKKFYSTLFTNLNNLDRKYLIAEMLSEPEFLEASLLKDILDECGRSMAENVALHRRHSKDFREYIEMWVHEAKLPIAALELICQNNPEIQPKVSGQLKKLDDYIENVLFYARSENAEKDYIIKDVVLQKAFGNAAVKNRELLQSINAEITASFPGITVLTDGKWLEFIIGQLMSNSIKYRSPDRSLTICATAEDLPDRVIFRFRDNGIGIAEQDLPRIFDKSFTGLNGRINPNSTGMGLYIVNQLCSRLGHVLSVTSKQGEYTEFSLTFAKNGLYRL